MAARDTQAGDLEPLLVHLGWVRQLAHQLVADANQAEDLVQETWLAAARHPPRAGGEPRAWLGRVLNNALRQLRRSEAARVRREHAVATRASNEELQGSMDMQRRLAACVMALDEPYRRTVILRYFREIPARAIAAQEDLPLATVKTRLRRALLQLRERLDREHDGDRDAWMSALLPIMGNIPTHSAAGAGAIIVSTKSVVLFLAVVALMLMAGLSLWTGEGDDSGVEFAAPGTTGETGAEVFQDFAGVEALAHAVEGGQAEARAEARTAGSSRVCLQVIDRTNGAPASGVEVWYAAQSAVDGWYTADREELLVEAGRKVVSDEAGEVFLTGHGEGAFAVARSGGLYGELWIPAEPEESLILELILDRTITIQVVNEAGTLLPGIPVGVWLKGPRHSQQLQWRGSTGLDGTVSCTHADHRLPGILDEGLVPYAALDATLFERVEAALDPLALGYEPARLVLPETGSVTVLLNDEQGLPAADCWVYAYPITSDVGSGNRLEKGHRHSVHSREGRAHFSHVGLGMDLEFTAQPGSDYREVVHKCAGPTVAGEELVLRLGFDEKWPVLVGRALSAPDEVLGTTMLSGRIRVQTPAGEDLEQTVWVQTDAEGGFRIPIKAEPGPRTSMWLHLRSGVGESEVLSADLEHTLDPGDIQVGDVLLGEPSVVLAGRITNQLGEPLYWADVIIARKRYYGDARERWTYDWIQGLTAQSDHEGNFTCTGELSAGEYLYKARASDHLDTDLLPFQPGERDLQIELVQVGSLLGSVLTPDGISPTRVALDVHLAGETRATINWSNWVRRPRPDGSFAVEELAPGLVDVHLRLDPDSPPLLRIDEVRIDPGGKSSDPRLQGIDLRSILRRIELEVVDSGGRPVSAAQVSVRPSGDADAPPVHTVFEDGDVLVITASAAVELEVRAPGFLTARLSGVRDDQRIVLQEGIPLRVKLPPGVELPEPPVVLRLAVVPDSDYARCYDEYVCPEDSERYTQWLHWIWRQAPAFGPERELLLFLPQEGAHRVHWLLESNEINGRRSGVTPARDGSSLEVSAGTVERVLEIGPDPKALKDALSDFE
jgi:RNA polymerase sigma factor (sigma-70 family)